MIRLFALLFLSITFLAPTLKAGENAWEKYHTDEKGTLFFYDSNSVKSGSNKILQVWTRTEYSPKSVSYEKSKVIKSLILSEIECIEKTTRTLEGTAFFVNGGTVTVIKSERMKIAPGTAAENLRLKLCK